MVLSLVSPWVVLKSVAVSVPVPPLKRSAPVPPVSLSLPAPPERVSSPAPPESLSLPSPPHRRSFLSDPFSVSSPFWPKSMSAPPVPSVVLEPLPSAFRVMLTVPVSSPSSTVKVRTAVPVLPERAVAVSVLAAPVPPKVRLELVLGTSLVFEEVALSTRSSSGPSGSLTVRLIWPERSLVPHEPPAATSTVGASKSRSLSACTAPNRLLTPFSDRPAPFELIAVPFVLSSQRAGRAGGARRPRLASRSYWIPAFLQSAA